VRFEVPGFAGAAPLHGACSSYLVARAHTAVLFDCGPGALERLWRRGGLREVGAILISHKHAGHMLDLLLYAGDAARSVLAGRRPELYVPRVAPAARFDAAVACASTPPSSSCRSAR